MPRLEAVEREARRMLDDLMTGNRTEFYAHDPQYKRDVLVRLHQLLAGDDTRPFGDPNDD